MSLIKPSFVENLFYAFYKLEPDRPYYFNLVFRLGRSIFLQLGFENKAVELQKLIETRLEKPLSAPLFAILQAYYNPRFIYSKLAYCKIGDGIDSKEITRYDITMALESIKDWVYDEITSLSSFVRFTQNPSIIG